MPLQHSQSAAIYNFIIGQSRLGFFPSSLVIEMYFLDSWNTLDVSCFFPDDISGFLVGLLYIHLSFSHCG